MKFKRLHPNFALPEYKTDFSAGMDIHMPEAGILKPSYEGMMVGLGFAATVPQGYGAFLLPRSGMGAKFGVSLNNTIGLIEPDYTDEWKACLRLRNKYTEVRWAAGDRLLQIVILPILQVTPTLVKELKTYERTGGFGSTGK